MNRSQSTNNSLSAEAFTSPCLFSLSILCHKFPFYSNCSCGWNMLQPLHRLFAPFYRACCPLFIPSQPPVRPHLRRLPGFHHIVWTYRFLNIWGYQWNLLFGCLTQARSHCQVGWLFLRLLIHSHPFPPFLLFVPITFLPVSVPTVRKKSICYWSRTCSHPAFSWLSRFIAGQLPCGEKRTTNIFGWQTGGIYSQTPLGWSVGHACMVRSIFDLSNGFVS